ncbi:XRE family transcriptional regulator [Streptomyces triticagri]|uniref:XRE family transcriptional regulator n=1 Tax=Streptomyces triticagri TaxID=2293568 RepID=A0A372M569_9ACTN|nr:helix-turn-helix transcriptional regulator [Streptomyces triticagri]RFU86031.1 XRE family transcriptional regulator [Streptomyces triticagri]
MTTEARNHARVVPLRPATQAPPAPKEPLWRDVVGEVLRRERLAQGRTLKEVSEAARISMPYLSELERGRKEASSEVLAAAAQALGLALADLLTLVRDDLLAATEPARPVSTISHLGHHPTPTTPGPTSAHCEVRLAA